MLCSGEPQHVSGQDSSRATCAGLSSLGASASGWLLSSAAQLGHTMSLNVAAVEDLTEKKRDTLHYFFFYIDDVLKWQCLGCCG